MADIELTKLTNTSLPPESGSGSGVFDVLIQVVEKHIKDQYDTGRILGSDYANVYLGSMQSVLSESINFLLNEQQADKQADLISEQINSEIKNNEPGGLIDLEKRKAQEEIDLIIARTASEYEKIDASIANTTRADLHNGRVISKLDEEISMVIAQRTDQEYITDNLRPREVEKVEEEIDLLQSRDLEQIAATIRLDAESAEKVKLIEAQTLGFKVDGKQKLLKQMFEGFAIEVTTNGAVPTPPSTSSSTSLEAVANSIYEDLGGLDTI